MLRADGERHPVEYSATARFVAGRHLAILRDITDRKRAEAERAELRRREQQRLRETETLLAVTRAVSSTLDPTETLRRLAREITRALRADMVGAYLADADPREPAARWPAIAFRADDDRRFPPLSDPHQGPPGHRGGVGCAAVRVDRRHAGRSARRSRDAAPVPAPVGPVRPHPREGPRRSAASSSSGGPSGG